MSETRTAVVALGGNAITTPDRDDTIANQFENARKSLGGIIELAQAGYKLLVSHGNGPQVGNALLRVELSRGKAPRLPLGILVADTEGGMGYMIEQSLQNCLAMESIDRPVVTLITQMLVDEHDPAIKNPTKFVGQFYSEEKANSFAKERSWVMKADGERGWRRVVPSPTPLKAINSEAIKKLVDDGVIVIAGGGGGIPVYKTDKGTLEGLDAVIDKDLCSAVLATEINANVLAILTVVDNVMLNFGKPDEKAIGQCSLREIKKFLRDGHFPAGSMGPKVKAAIRFLESGGDMVVITSIDNAASAVKGNAGTRILPD